VLRFELELRIADFSRGNTCEKAYFKIEYLGIWLLVYPNRPNQARAVGRTVWAIERSRLTEVSSVAGQIYFAGGTETAVSHCDEGT